MLGLSNGLIYSSPVEPQPQTPGWLKVEFVSTQTGVCSIGIDPIGSTVSPGAVGALYDQVTIDYKIYIDNSTGAWDPEGDDDDVKLYITGMVADTGTDIPVNQVVDYSATIDTNSGGGPDEIQFAVWIDADDRPQAGAVFYIKDIVIRVNRVFAGVSSPTYIGQYISDFRNDIIGSDNSDQIVTAGNGTINVTTNQGDREAHPLP